MTDTSAVPATDDTRPSRALRWDNRSRDVMKGVVDTNPDGHAAGHLPGIPSIYRFRYVTRSPVRVSVNTRSSPLIEPVAALA